MVFVFLSLTYFPWKTYILFYFILFYFFKDFIYLFMIVTERERGRDTGRGRSRLHAPGARRGIRSRVSRIVPWAKGRRYTTAPPRDPSLPKLGKFSAMICSNMLSGPLSLSASSGTPIKCSFFLLRLLFPLTFPHGL